jgi:uncharacterized protein YndB with AHSA1/START domain
MPTTATATATDTTAIERDLHIEASPETVYSYFTEPARVARWFGRRNEMDARPGGLLRLDFNGFDIMRGSFLELVPHSRIVFTWGWESLNADALQPGGSRVEITLTPKDGGTDLHLVHSDLPAHDAGAHGMGWDYGLERLVAAINGAPITTMLGGKESLTNAEELAGQLNTLLIEAATLISTCPEERWTVSPASGDTRPANVIADHIAGHVSLVSLATAIATETDSPIAKLTAEQLEANNAHHREKAAAVSRDEVLRRIRTDGPKAVDALKALDDAGLARAAPMAFADGASVPAAAIVDGPILNDIRDHIASLRAAIGA